MAVLRPLSAVLLCLLVVSGSVACRVSNVSPEGARSRCFSAIFSILQPGPWYNIHATLWYAKKTKNVN